MEVSLNPSTAKKLGFEAGARVRISFDGISGEAALKMDEAVSAGVALVPRSMGIAIREPVVARLQNAAKGK
jgi:anaerobic selenocysteine-containing dehydrogenase